MKFDSPLRASPADILCAFSIADEPEVAILPLSRRVRRLAGRLCALRPGFEPMRAVDRVKAACHFGSDLATPRARQPFMWPAWTAAGRSETEGSRPYRGQIRSHFDGSSRPGEKRIA